MNRYSDFLHLKKKIIIFKRPDSRFYVFQDILVEISQKMCNHIN